MAKSPQSIGGRARANQLSPERRKEIARKAALTKHAIIAENDLPTATHSAEREIDGYLIPVHNLSDGRRVISERGFLAIIGAKGRGSSGGHRLARILGDPIIKLFFSNDLLAAIESKIAFLSTTNTLTYGYPDKVLNDFCIAFSKAKNAGALKTEAQMRYASYCEALLYAFSGMGIAAWIDEATGFQKDRARDALHKILERYIADHWARWAKTFPDEFYEHIYRLRNLPYDPDKVARPGFIGRVTTDIAYSRLAPGIIEELQRKNPVITETKRRKHKHFQWLTEDFGNPKLKEHLGKIIFLMSAHSSWDSFYRRLQRAAPKLHETAEFDFGDDE